MDELLLLIVVACVLALVSAFGVILATRPVYGAMALLAHSLVLAGLYLMLAAELVAVAQVLIYSGAIVVVFLFVIALLPVGGAEHPSAARSAAAVLAGGLLLAALAAVLAAGAPSAVPDPELGLIPLAQALFGPIVPSLQLVAPLLLVAIVGAVALWRRQAERLPWSRQPTRMIGTVEPPRSPVEAGPPRRDDR